MEIELARGYWVEIWKWLQFSEGILNTMNTNERLAFNELLEKLDAEFEG